MYWKASVMGVCEDIVKGGTMSFKETVLVQGVSVTDCESLLYETYKDFAKEHFHVKSCGETSCDRVIWPAEIILEANNRDGDYRAYEIKLASYYTDEGGKRKADAQISVVVFADTIEDAQMMALDYGTTAEVQMEITSVGESKSLRCLISRENMISPLVKTFDEVSKDFAKTCEELGITITTHGIKEGIEA